MSILPSGYTRLKYIQSSGTQHIDTGVPYSLSTIVVKITAICSTASTYLCGWDAGGQILNRGGKWANDGATSTISALVKTSIVQTIPTSRSENSTLVLTQNGTTETISRGTASLATYATLNYPLFKRASQSEITRGGTSQIFDCEIYVNDVLTRHFIPAIRNSDDEVGMYDLVTSTFFTNAGTGTFVAGDVDLGQIDLNKSEILFSRLPDEYTECEYIQNGGNTRVQTGIIPSSANNEIYIRFYCNDTGSMYLFQSRYGESQGSTIYGITGSLSNATIQYVINGQAVTSSITRTAGHIYTVKGSCNGTTMTLYVKDETTDTEATNTGTLSSYVAASTQLDLFANEGSDRLAGGYRIYECYYKEDSVELLHYYAAKDSTNDIGFYDTVSDTFKTESTGSLTAGPEVTHDLTICKGSIIFDTANLFDKDATRTLTISDMIANKDNVLFTDCNIPNKTVGATVPVNADVKSINIPCKKGDAFTIYFHGGFPSGANSRCYWCEVDGNMVLTKATDVYTLTNNAYTFTITEDATEVIIIEMETITDLCKDVVVLVEGSTIPSTYIPHTMQIDFYKKAVLTD